MSLSTKIDQLATEAFAELHAFKRIVQGDKNIPVTGKVLGQEELKTVAKARFLVDLQLSPLITRL